MNVPPAPPTLPVAERQELLGLLGSEVLVDRVIEAWIDYKRRQVTRGPVTTHDRAGRSLPATDQVTRLRALHAALLNARRLLGQLPVLARDGYQGIDDAIRHSSAQLAGAIEAGRSESSDAHPANHVRNDSDRRLLKSLEEIVAAAGLQGSAAARTTVRTFEIVLTATTADVEDTDASRSA